MVSELHSTYRHNVYPRLRRNQFTIFR